MLVEPSKLVRVFANHRFPTGPRTSPGCLPATSLRQAALNPQALEELGIGGAEGGRIGGGRLASHHTDVSGEAGVAEGT
jgi:hypothetical protein